MSPNAAAGRVEQLSQAIAARVVTVVLEAIDINAVVANVDVDALIHRVDVEAIIERVDVNAIVKRVDVEAIIERVDVNAIVKRVDVNAIVSDIDIDSLVSETELGSIIAKSTSGIFTDVLDAVRAQGVGLDDFCARWTDKILRRTTANLPLGPGVASGAPARGTSASTSTDPARSPELLAPATSTGASLEAADQPGDLGQSDDSAPPPELTVERQGQYAGAVSRMVAFAGDVGASWGIYVGAVALVGFAVNLITGRTFDLSKYPVIAVTSLGAWEFAYFAYQWAVAGQTIGMAVFGIRVVDAGNAGPINGGAAVIRTLTFPLSIIVFFMGFLGILVNRERRAWHDRFAGTAVVYAWDARAARLRRLADRGPHAATWHPNR